MTFAYDRVRYPSTPQRHTHPSRIGALASLYGVPFVPARHCRVLEIGCGDGTNLLSMAATLPQSEFVGFDLAAGAIADGQKLTAASGLTNVDLQVIDITDTAAASLGRFDYIIAHGIYAWVPAPVRDAVMRLIGGALTDNGLAFVSYNAMPGCRARQVLRDILKDAVRGITSPAEILAAAKECLEFFSERWGDKDPLHAAAREQARNLLQRPPEVLFHDELGEIYEPQFVADVAAHAARNGLQYLCDTQGAIAAEAFFPDEKWKPLHARAGGDWVRFEQLLDFTLMMRFRQTILCRAGVAIDRRADYGRLRALYAQGRFFPDTAAAEPGTFRFSVKESGEIVTIDAAFAELIARIGAASPSSIPVADFVTGQDIGDGLLRLFIAGTLSLHTEPSAFTLTPGERPTASPLARAQIAQGQSSVASLAHASVKLTDQNARHFLQLLDGTRNRAELAAAMAKFSGTSQEATSTRIDGALDELAHSALLQ